MKPMLVLAMALAPLEVDADGLPQLIAHRGGSANAPENTLAAFRLAWEEGADGIEGDFYLTADGEVVCIHDKTTKRTAGRNLSVTGSTLEELRRLDIGAWKGPEFRGERIPTLAEVLDLVPVGKWFFLEIKDTPRIVEPLARILEDKKADPERVVLISFDPAVVEACVKRLPDHRVCWISALKDFKKPGVAGNYLKVLSRTGAHGLLFKHDAPVTAEWLRQAWGKDRLLMAWTVDDPQVARRMVELGVDFIGTNRPRELRAELKVALDSAGSPGQSR